MPRWVRHFIVGWLKTRRTSEHDAAVPPPLPRSERLRSPQTQLLYETSERFKTLIGNSPLAVVEWNPDRRITGWTGNSESLFGWSVGEVVGKRQNEFGLIHPDDQKAVRSALDALEQGRSSVVRNRNYHKNGSVIYCEWYNSAMLNESGRLVWGLSLALDITASHRMEEALRTSEEKFRNIFAAAPVGIFQSIAEGRFLNVNSRLATMLHFKSPEEMIRLVPDTGVELFVHPEQPRNSHHRSQFVCNARRSRQSHPNGIRRLY